MKSNAAAFGAGRLEGLCRELESAAKSGELDRGRDLLDRLEAELGRVTVELEEIHAELGG
jgi:HPt (histidine-containing phosphotransfer) domain-containing protein